MDVLSHSPLPVASLLWQKRPGSFVTTAVCKATFRLQPGTMQLSPEQEPVYTEDSYWDDDRSRSLFAASELTPHKPRIDVVLVGSAFVPNNQPTRSLAARLIVGEIDKTIDVVHDRHFTQDGVLVEGPRFTRMPLVYERAGGGSESWNPVGVRSDARDAYGRVRLPNLYPPGFTVQAMGEVVPAVGFGPIAADWAWRRDKLGRHVGFSSNTLAHAPLPEDLDRSYFNFAPRDQQLAALAEDARIILENLSPTVPRLVTNLPGMRPRVVLEGRGGVYPLVAILSSLRIDTVQARCSLTWSVELPLERRDEPGRVVVTLDAGGAHASSSSLQAVTDPGIRSQHGTIPPDDDLDELDEGQVTSNLPNGLLPRNHGLPFASSGIMAAPAQLNPSTGLPFAPNPAPANPEPPRASPSFHPPPIPSATPWATPGQTPAPQAVAPVAAARPWPEAPPMRPSESSMPAVQVPPRPHMQSQLGIPPMINPASATPPPVPPVVSAPPAYVPSPAPARVEPVVAKSFGELAVAAATAAATATPADTAVDPKGGVLAASNAAAGPQVRKKIEEAQPNAAPQVVARPSPKLDARDIVDLLWFDRPSVPRIGRVPVWKKILDDLEDEPADEDIDEPPPTESPAEVEDRRDMFEILTRGASLDADQVQEHLVAAVRPSGKFVPPIVLLAGELSFPFAPREALKATVSAAAPLASADEGLRNIIKDARDLLAQQDLLASSQMFESMTTRVRDAFQKARRGAAADYLDTQVESALVEGRHYQRRQVLGMNAIRALLHSQTASGARPVPVYIPADAEPKLPMYQRIRARMIAEIHLQGDQQEQHPASLKVLVLGRLSQMPEPRVKA